MKYRHRAVEPFWKHFHRLSNSPKYSARQAWKIFKENPFDARLRPHKIQRLSSLYRETIYAVDIEDDLRAVFFIEADWIVTVDIGTHDNYKG